MAFFAFENGSVSIPIKTQSTTPGMKLGGSRIKNYAHNQRIRKPTEV